MEDELCVIPDFQGYLYAAVFDGHSGVAAASWLHDNLQEYIGPALEQAPSPELALHAAFVTADVDLLEHLAPEGKRDAEVNPAGATGSVVLVTPEAVTTANLGDSSVVLSRKGQDVRLSEIHRVYGREDSVRAEIDRVNSSGGWVSDDGRVCDMIAVSRAFGDWEFKGRGLDYLLREGAKHGIWTKSFAAGVKFNADPVISVPAVATTPLSQAAGDEFMVLASDGLWDFYKQSDAMRFVRKQLRSGDAPQQVAEALVERALKRHTADNIAVVVITLPWFR